MNRHEGVICNGCMKDNFSGRCYRCLTCRDFDLCADCYDRDFSTSEHLFDHPVKCIFTQADIELYFGGEYINGDPPQSYRCPYCKVWGFNESMFLEHISELHPNASPQLVSTVVNLFEQQQAARIFLEEEQLAAFAASTNSRNRMINRQNLGIELILQPLNADGSYQTDDANLQNVNVNAGNNINTVNQLMIHQRGRGRRNRNRGGSNNNGNSAARNRSNDGVVGDFGVNWSGSHGTESGRNRGGGDSLLNGINDSQSGVSGNSNNCDNQSRGSARCDIVNRTIQQQGGILQISLPTIPEQTIPNAPLPGDSAHPSMSMSDRLRLTFCEADRERVSILMHSAFGDQGQHINSRIIGPTLPEQQPMTPIPDTSSLGHTLTLTEMMRYYTGRINALVADGVPVDTLAAPSNTTSNGFTANNIARSGISTANDGRNRSGRVRMHLESIGQLQQRGAGSSDDPTGYLQRLQRCNMMPAAFANEAPRTFLSLANQTTHNSWSNGNGVPVNNISGSISNSRSRVIRLTAPYHTRNVSGPYNSDNMCNGTSNGNSTARASRADANENFRNAVILRTIEEEMRALEGIRLRHDTAVAFDVNDNSLRQVVNTAKTKTPTLNADTDDKKTDEAQDRFLLKKYLQPRCDRHENYTRFLANRAEFVSQLLMSAMSDDELVLPNRLTWENLLPTENETKPLKCENAVASSAAHGAAGDAGASVVEPSINNENEIQDTYIESSTISDTNEGADGLVEEEVDEQIL